MSGINTEKTLNEPGGRSPELPTKSYQDPNSTQSEHGRYDCLDPKRETESDGFVQPLIVEEDDERGEDSEEVHYRRNFFGRFWMAVDDVRETEGEGGDCDAGGEYMCSRWKCQRGTYVMEVTIWVPYAPRPLATARCAQWRCFSTPKPNHTRLD